MATTPAAKRRMRAPERRAQLLQVARHAFVRNGFHGVSMEEVAREAGVTKPVLYDHFPSKEALYLALLDADASALEVRVQGALDARTGNQERIRESFRAYFDFVDEHAEGFVLLMQEAVNPMFLSSSVNAVRDRIVREVARLIVRDSHERIGPKDADTVALGLVAMVEAAAQRNVGGRVEDRRRQVDILVQLAWRGVAGLRP